MLEPSGVKLGSSPLSEVIWLKPPPVFGSVAMPVLVPVARSVPKRPRHLLLSADTKTSPSGYGLVWFPRRDPGLTTRPRRPNDNSPLRGDVGREEGAPKGSLFSQLVEVGTTSSCRRGSRCRPSRW